MTETWADPDSVRTPREASVVVSLTRTENLRRRKVCMRKSAGSCGGWGTVHAVRNGIATLGRAPWPGHSIPRAGAISAALAK